MKGNEPKYSAQHHLIRKATVDDAEVLLDLIVEHVEYEREKYSTEGKLELLVRCLRTDPPPFQSLLIESDGAVLGYCNYLVQFDSWAMTPHLTLDALYLKPELRGKGIGMEIMSLLRAEAKSAHCTTVRWQTPVFNELGINFYKKLDTLSGTKMFFTWDVI